MSQSNGKSDIGKRFFKSPQQLVILLALTIFIAEFVIMMGLHLLSPYKSLILALIDSFILLVLITPELYYWVFQPMINYLAGLKKAKDQAVWSEERYRKLFSTLFEGSCSIDIEFDENRQPSNFRFMEINPALQKLLGLSNAEGKPLKDLLPDLDPRWLDIFGKIALTGEPERYEEEAEILGRYYKVSAYRLTNLEKKQIAVLFSDITELKNKEEELTPAKERAEESDKLKSAFLTTISHEIRTPLNSILGFTGILLQGMSGPLNDEQKKQLGIMQYSGNHLLSLINNILDLSKLEAGQMKISFEEFSLEQVIKEVIESEKESARVKGLSLQFIPSGDCGFLDSDRLRVHQILLNLINNAVKFTEKGSVTIRCYKENDFVRLEVSDTGIGIKNEHLSKIFNPFIQIDNDLIRKNKETGSGLGLSITQKLVEMLHGTIGVESEYGKGSTFTITLPVARKRKRA